MTKYLVEADLTRDGAYAWVGGVLIDAKHLTPVVPEAEAVLSEAVACYHRAKRNVSPHRQTPLFKATEAYVKATTPANPVADSVADSVARVEAAWGEVIRSLNKGDISLFTASTAMKNALAALKESTPNVS